MKHETVEYNNAGHGLGAVAGNELHRYLQLPDKDANHVAAAEFLKKNGIKIDAISRKADNDD